jgi:hypothetical protein
MKKVLLTTCSLSQITPYYCPPPHNPWQSVETTQLHPVCTFPFWLLKVKV